MPTPEQLVGAQYEGKRGHYVLERYLGEGLTSWVYAATDLNKQVNEGLPVAVKVMRVGLGPLEADKFRAEASSLAGLQGARAAAAPDYYEHFATGRPEAPEILVLELMTGVKVEDILIDDGPFPEKEAIDLGVQLMDLLNILHTQLQRTYTDFKFENLWWSRAEGKLKVTDWNVLSDVGNVDRASSDLLRASRYLYHILTGNEAREQGGIVVTPFARHPNWASLSLPCQTVMQQALHRYPEKRYNSAADMLEALKRVQTYWALAAGRLLNQVDSMVNAPYQRATYMQAQEMLDVLRLRSERGEAFSASEVQTLDELRLKVDNKLNAEQTALERGQHLFSGNSFQEAETWFIQVVGEDPWNPIGWRWREASRAGMVTSEFARYTGDVERALNALQNGEYVRADNALPAVATLNGLRGEIQMRRGLDDAERLTIQGHQLVEAGRGDSPEADDLFKQAQQAFGEAADALNSITPPDYREMLRQEVGDPAKRGRELVDAQRSAAALAGRELRSAQENIRAGQWQAAAGDLTRGLEAAPGEPRLIELCLRLGKEQFTAGNLATAVDLFALASRYEPLAGPAHPWWRAAEGVSRVDAMIKAGQGQSALDELDRVAGNLLPPEVAEVAADQLQRLVDDNLARAAEAETLSELTRWLAAPASIARLAPSKAAWASDVQRNWPAVLDRYLVARQAQVEPASFLALAAAAFSSTPAAARQSLAETLQPALSQALAAVPATQDPERSALVMRAASSLLDATPELAASPWSADVAAYQVAFEQEQYARRQARFEGDQQIIEGLMAAGNRDSLTQARSRLDEAKALTPADSPQYQGLLTLERRLAQLETDQLSGAERRQRIERVFAEFEGRLGVARSEDDFDRLQTDLEDARNQASRVQDRSAMDACTEKIALVALAKSDRLQAAGLEAQLDKIRGQIAAVGKLGDQPGASTTVDSLWRELLAATDHLLALHPFHSDALKARQDYQDYSGATTLQERVSYVEAVSRELGEPLQQFRQAEAYWLDAEPDKATPLLAALPPDWQAMDRIQKLTGDVATGVAFLAAAQMLTQTGLLSDSFDQKLNELLGSQLPPDYLDKSALPPWLAVQRSGAVRALTGPKEPDRKKTPSLLAQAVAADQSLRLVTTVQQGGPLPDASVETDATGFVEQALPLLSAKQGKDGMLNNALETLALGLAPAALGRQVEQTSRERLAGDRGSKRSRLLGRVLMVAGGLALLALLAAFLGLIWPGVMPNSRASLLAAAQTATANPPTPEVRTVQETVLVIHTATAAPVPPTDTPVSPTATPVPPTATPIPPYADPTRIAGELEGLQAVNLDLGTDQDGVSRTLVISEVIAVLDNTDPDAGLLGIENGSDATLSTDTEFGRIGGMTFLDVNAIEDPTPIPPYTWPDVTSVPTGTYHLLAFVPSEHGTVKVDYYVETLLDDGTPVGRSYISGISPKQLDQSGFGDQWVDLGEFVVDRPGNLRVVAQATRDLGENANGAEPFAAFDAVAFVRAQ